MIVTDDDVPAVRSVSIGGVGGVALGSPMEPRSRPPTAYRNGATRHRVRVGQWYRFGRPGAGRRLQLSDRRGLPVGPSRYLGASLTTTHLALMPDFMDPINLLSYFGTWALIGLLVVVFVESGRAVPHPSR